MSRTAEGEPRVVNYTLTIMLNVKAPELITSIRPSAKNVKVSIFNIPIRAGAVR